MEEPVASLPEKARQKVEETSQPEWVEPMLATLTHEHFSDTNWIYERKLDGERCLAFRDGDEVRLRQPRYLGLRRDKAAEEVVKES